MNTNHHANSPGQSDLLHSLVSFRLLRQYHLRGRRFLEPLQSRQIIPVFNLFIRRLKLRRRHSRRRAIFYMVVGQHFATMYNSLVDVRLKGIDEIVLPRVRRLDPSQQR